MERIAGGAPEDSASQGCSVCRCAEENERAGMLACQGWKRPKPRSPKAAFRAKFGEYLACEKISSLPICNACSKNGERPSALSPTFQENDVGPQKGADVVNSRTHASPHGYGPG